MSTLRESPHFEPLLKRYVRSPSIALCRVPEVELLSRVTLVHPVLDHCCGDGLIADMAFPGARMDAGVDISQRQLGMAKQRGNYRELHLADAGDRLPFPDESFFTVINNSGLEHILSLETAVAEISRVLKPGGRFYLNVLNSRYFERWPLSPETAERYRAFQPFYHAFDEKGWADILGRSHFGDMTFTDYLPEPTSRMLAELDYHYSACHFRKAFPISVLWERFLPRSRLIRKWRNLLESLVWDSAPGMGGGFLISASKRKGVF
jgi:SAM-dependent methyltransferase